MFCVSPAAPQLLVVLAAIFVRGERALVRFSQSQDYTHHSVGHCCRSERCFRIFFLCEPGCVWIVWFVLSQQYTSLMFLMRSLENFLRLICSCFRRCHFLISLGHQCGCLRERSLRSVQLFSHWPLFELLCTSLLRLISLFTLVMMSSATPAISAALRAASALETASDGVVAGRSAAFSWCISDAFGGDGNFPSVSRYLSLSLSHVPWHVLHVASSRNCTCRISHTSTLVDLSSRVAHGDLLAAASALHAVSSAAVHPP